jgi:uncharacterized protein (TIGR03083 family)
MGEVAEAYESCRQRVSAIAGASGQDGSSRAVPACPGWTVRDVLAHLTGVVDDVLAGRLDGVATDPWTAAQVEARRTRRVEEILSEWQEKGPAFAGLLDSVGPPGHQAVTDAVTHEHDIRGALGVPGARDSDAVRIGLNFLAPLFVASAEECGVRVSVQVEGGARFGREDARSVMRGDSFTLLRAMTGRRSEDHCARSGRGTRSLRSRLSPLGRSVPLPRASSSDRRSENRTVLRNVKGAVSEDPGFQHPRHGGFLWDRSGAGPASLRTRGQGGGGRPSRRPSARDVGSLP